MNKTESEDECFIIYLHKAKKWITCLCGELLDFYSDHKCLKIVGNKGISIRQCKYDKDEKEITKQCKICEEATIKRKYKEYRWKKDGEGHRHCAQCGERVYHYICDLCFCQECFEKKEDFDNRLCNACKQKQETEDD